MKATDVIKQYKNGERNFQRLNLRGANFKGQNLSGANFSYCQLQSANFSHANLTNTKFIGAKAGLSLSWIRFLFLFSIFFATVAGFTSSIIFTFIIYYFTEKPVNRWRIFFYSTAFITIIRSALSYFESFLDKFLDLTFIHNILSDFIGSDSTVAFQINVAILVIIGIAFFGAYVAVIDEPESGIGSVLILTFILLVILLISLPFFRDEINILQLTIGELLGGIIGAIIGSSFSQKAISEDKKFHWLWKIYLDLANLGGTHFNHAILTDADFSGASLKGTDFRTQNLIRTNFKDTKFHTTRLAKTILANPTVRDLLIDPSSGEDIDLSKAYLRGAYLKGAYLKGANLKNADISEATFEHANLSNANLTEVKAIKTNFTNARLTGAYLENWTIDLTTILDNVECEYVFLLEAPNKYGSQERQPSSGDFKAGEFTKLYKEVFKSINLTFEDGINWKAFIETMKKVQKDNKETPLEVSSIEDKGDEFFVVKVKVPTDADQEKIHEKIQKNYQDKLKSLKDKHTRSLTEKDKEMDTQRLLAEKDIKNKDEIIEIERQNKNDIMEITKKLADLQIKIMNKNMNTGDFNNYGVLNLGEIIGDVNNTINQISESNNKENEQLKSLLQELMQAIETEDELDEDEKAEAANKVKTIAKASQNPEDKGLQKKATRAVKLLETLANGLGPATKLCTACHSILPQIVTFLGITL